jgi:hypothetical protein
LAARRQVYDYVDRVWQNAKDDGLNPACRRDWQPWSTLRDLMGALLELARKAEAERQVNDRTL